MQCLFLFKVLRYFGYYVLHNIIDLNFVGQDHHNIKYSCCPMPSFSCHCCAVVSTVALQLEGSVLSIFVLSLHVLCTCAGVPSGY